MLISDWSSDVCSSDLEYLLALAIPRRDTKPLAKALLREFDGIGGLMAADWQAIARVPGMGDTSIAAIKIVQATMLRMLRNEVAEKPVLARSEKHTSELQSLVRISYAVFCLKKKKKKQHQMNNQNHHINEHG